MFPFRKDGKKRHVHEEYSAAIIRHLLRDAIENHPLNGNYDFKADDVAALIEGSSRSARRVFWRDVITGQMDADRMDYLLRDSLHAGVDYGKYDWRRLLNTVVAVEIPEPEGESSRRGLRLGVTEGGIHAAEGLILARYFMFTQVYFHKTRVAYLDSATFRLATVTVAGVCAQTPALPCLIVFVRRWTRTPGHPRGFTGGGVPTPATTRAIRKPNLLLQ